MVLIFDKNTGEIKALFSGNSPQLDNILSGHSQLIGVLDEVIFDDDKEVLNSPSDYRIIVFDGIPITYTKKPLMTLNLENGLVFARLLGDGEDSVNLNIAVSELHPLEAMPSSYRLIINNSLQIVEEGYISITSDDPGLRIRIQGDSNFYRSNFVELEVV